jgi:hypothetical protein
MQTMPRLWGAEGTEYTSRTNIVNGLNALFVAV